MAIDAVQRGDKVLDLGCGSARIASELRQKKKCHVTGVDRAALSEPEVGRRLDRFIEHDLSPGALPADLDDDYDVVLLLDIIEHLSEPEELLDALRCRLGHCRPRLILTTGNVAFLPVRASLALGRFNYGSRGILDKTHTRLFTFDSLRSIIEQSGLQITEMSGVPAPYPLALGHNRLSKLLLNLNETANRVSRSLFAYQIYVEAMIAPTVQTLLGETIKAEDMADRRGLCHRSVQRPQRSLP